jgi:hypothetical protein
METFTCKFAYANLLGLQLKFVVTHFETFPVHPCLRVVIRVLNTAASDVSTFQSHTNTTVAGGLVLHCLSSDCINCSVYTTKINYLCIIPAAAAAAALINIMERSNAEQYYKTQ